MALRLALLAAAAALRPAALQPLRTLPPAAVARGLHAPALHALGLQPPGLPSAACPRLCAGARGPARRVGKRGSTTAICVATEGAEPPLPASNAFRVIAATLLITLDITFYTFPLPFFGDFLSTDLRCSPSSIANLIATFTYSALATGGAIVLMEGRRETPRSERQQCLALASAGLVMASVAAAQALHPTYAVLFIARLVQGATSQFAWSTALAAAASLRPLGNIKATAWVMAGNSLGELTGPQFGSTLYNLGGVRLPFAAASALAFLLAAAFGSSAIALKQQSEAPAAIEAAEPLDGCNLLYFP